MPTIQNVVQAQNLVSTIYSAVSGVSGWTTEAGSYLTRTLTSGGSLALNITGSTSALTITQNFVAGTKPFYVVHGSTQATGVVRYLLSFDTDYFFLQVEGPVAGAYGSVSNQSGSYKSSFFTGTYTPAAGQSPVTRICTVGGPGNASISTANYNASASTSGINDTIQVATDCALVTVQPLNVNNFVQARLNENVMVFPVQLHEYGYGLRGTIDKLFYCGPDSTPADGTAGFAYLNRTLIDEGGQNYQVVGWGKSNPVGVVPLGSTESYSPAGEGAPAVAIPVS